jgi:hypothetical protein
MSGITPFVMLPGAGPACEGDDCLPTAAAPQQADPAPAAS